MSMIEFEKLMTHTLTLRKRDKNESGDFSDISSVSLSGFVQFGNNLIEKSKDEKMLSTAIVFLKDDCGIDISHEYWMVNQVAPYNRPNMEVLKIDPIDDPETGLTHHFELMVR